LNNLGWPSPIKFSPSKVDLNPQRRPSEPPFSSNFLLASFLLLFILFYYLNIYFYRAFNNCLNNLGWPSPIKFSPSKVDLNPQRRPSEPPLRRESAADQNDANQDLLLLGRSFMDLLILQSSLQQDKDKREETEDVTQQVYTHK
jgi:hypothetical protein